MKYAVMAIIVLTALGGLVLATGLPLAAGTPDAALKRFYEQSPYSVKEEQLRDPLILQGQSVVPRLLGEVTRKDMPRRSYAILALGDIGDRAALGTLERIVSDPDDGARCDALLAIAFMDRQHGRALARQFAGARDSCLSQTSALVLSNAALGRRTRLRIWLGDFHQLLFGE